MFGRLRVNLLDGAQQNVNPNLLGLDQLLLQSLAMGAVGVGQQRHLRSIFGAPVDGGIEWYCHPCDPFDLLSTAAGDVDFLLGVDDPAQEEVATRLVAISQFAPHHQLENPGYLGHFADCVDLQIG